MEGARRFVLAVGRAVSPPRPGGTRPFDQNPQRIMLAERIFLSGAIRAPRPALGVRLRDGWRNGRRTVSSRSVDGQGSHTSRRATGTTSDSCFTLASADREISQIYRLDAKMPLCGETGGGRSLAQRSRLAGSSGLSRRIQHSHAPPGLDPRGDCARRQSGQSHAGQSGLHGIPPGDQRVRRRRPTLRQGLREGQVVTGAATAERRTKARGIVISTTMLTTTRAVAGPTASLTRPKIEGDSADAPTLSV